MPSPASAWATTSRTSPTCCAICCRCRWRRRMIARGSGDPSRLICSALIADAFTAVRYPILPKITLARSLQALEQILEIRHSSLYCPRDFDISPYFNVVKPTIRQGFNYKALQWADLPHAPDGDASL